MRNRIVALVKRMSQQTNYPFFIAAILCILFLLLGFSNRWSNIEAKSFDLLTVYTAPGKSSLPITIIGVDEESFAAMKRQWPWPRSVHAALIERLKQAGAAVIVFDIIFSEPSSVQEDKALTKAIANAGNVVLASDMVYQETTYTRQWIRVDPLQAFTVAGATTGLASMALDADQIIRKVPEEPDTLWRRTIQAFDKSRPGLLPPISVAHNAMIRYLGPAYTFPYVSYYQALEMDKSLPPDFFKDQIVLIGRNVRSSPDVGSAQADTLGTPFLSTDRWLTPGIEIHATLLENAIQGNSLYRVGEATNIGVFTVIIFLAAFTMRRWHPLRSALWSLLLMGFVSGLAWWLFTRENLWLPSVATLSGVVLLYILTGLLSFLIEKKRGQQIKFAFSRYVAASIVEQMIAQPEKLVLGGERREVTLLFADLAGFTTLSEHLPPDKTARLINTFLTRMARIILAHGGTVDKFIGDAIMAFWGAPLDDPQHALHAGQAAIDMQAAMKDLQSTFIETTGNQVGMRIGIHTGQAVIGNMGSAERFDYTAVGDAVNLAARLEGANKLYSTEILLSYNTAEKLGGTIPLRRVDQIRVKGRNQVVEVYTPCTDTSLCVDNDRAVQSYRAGQWAESRRFWQQVQKTHPEDSIARVYLERMGDKDTPPEGWSETITLEKL